MSAERVLCRLRRLPADDGGASAVEFALAAPVAIALLFAVFELGWAFNCGSSVRSAVEAASRSLLSNPNLTGTELQADAQARLSGLPITGLAVDVQREWVNGNVQVARVSWRYSYVMIVPWAPDGVLRFDSSLVAPVAN